MINKPKIVIEYLVDYELNISMSAENTHELSNPTNINGDNKIQGKKGFHLSGGSVDAVTGEVSGCILDGTYTLYSAKNKYQGLMGTVLSNDNYEFSTPQYIHIETANSNTYIKSLIIYFDDVANEYATMISFANAKKYDDTTGEIIDDTTISPTTKYVNNKTIFIKNFGQDSRLTSVDCYFDKWSKKNSLMKVLRVKTGFTGNYEYGDINKISFNQDLFSDFNDLKFGVTCNPASVTIIDRNDIIKDLYDKDLIYNNVEVRIYVDDELQNTVYINSKQGSNGSNDWTFECVDLAELSKNSKVDILQITENMKIIDIIKFALRNTGYEIEIADDVVDRINYAVPKAFLRANQSVYDVLLQCSQIALLRIYVRDNKIRIASGI